jgi:hypothetical protein
MQIDWLIFQLWHILLKNYGTLLLLLFVFLTNQAFYKN